MKISCIYAPECDQIIDTAHSKLKACRLCRASINFWVRQPEGRLIRRVNNLRKYANRMADVLTVPEEKKNAKGRLQKKEGKASKKQGAAIRAKRRHSAQAGKTVH